MAILLFGACGEKDMEQSMNVMVSSDVQTSESAEIGTKREDGENTTLTETESPKKVNEKLLDRAKVDSASIIYADSYSFEKLTFDGVELIDFECLLEAEEAEAAGFGGELSDAYTSFEMMEKVYNSEVMITRDELPKFE